MKSPILISTLVSLMIILSVLESCTWTPTVKTPIFSDPKGNVFLTTVPDPTLRSSHPVTLNSATLTTILSGIHLQQHSGLLQQLLTGEDHPTRVFSEAQVQFLTPHLVEAFGQVTAEEFVSFTLPPGDQPNEDAVEGYLYKQGALLIFTLGQSTNPSPRATRSKGSTSRSQPSQLQEPTLTFEPAAALLHNQSNSEDSYRPHSQQLIINYDFMTTWIPPQNPHDVTPNTLSHQDSGPIQKLDPSSETRKPSLSQDPQLPADKSSPTIVEPNNTNLNDLRQQMEKMNREIETQREEIKRLQTNPTKSPQP